MANAVPTGGFKSGTLAPFRYPVFRAIWIAMLFSWFGGLIQQVGAAWLMTSLTDSKALVALVQASSSMPIMLLALFAGAIADSYDRRKIMLVAQVGMFIASALLAFLTINDDLTASALLLMTLLVGIGTALNGPAWQASIRMQVSPEHIPAAISLNSVSFNLARSVGPAIGGILISIAGPALNFTVNAVSYLGIIVVLWRWKPSQTELRREPMGPAIMRGIRFCYGSIPVRHTLFRSSMFGLTAPALLALMPLIARDLLAGDQLTFGLMLAGFGIGSISGAMLAARIRRRFNTDRVVAIATWLLAIGTAGVSLSTTLPTALPMSFVGGVGWVLTNNCMGVVVQMRAPNDIAGRCISLYHVCIFGGVAVGAAFWGGIADVATVRVSLAVSAAALALTPLLRVVAPVPDVGEG